MVDPEGWSSSRHLRLLLKQRLARPPAGARSAAATKHPVAASGPFSQSGVLRVHADARGGCRAQTGCERLDPEPPAHNPSTPDSTTTPPSQWLPHFSVRRPACDGSNGLGSESLAKKEARKSLPKGPPSRRKADRPLSLVSANAWIVVSGCLSLQETSSVRHSSRTWVGCCTLSSPLVTKRGAGGRCPPKELDSRLAGDLSCSRSPLLVAVGFAKLRPKLWRHVADLPHVCCGTGSPPAHSYARR